ncbi:helix-turn-helix transcriptional regulator, partial [Marinobacter sp. C7]|uniref:helix-turn-helix domain-containing protein n=1 Tax=Marinobacter sp. C7 TaxID=2951363 RepID=UPI001EF09E6B
MVKKEDPGEMTFRERVREVIQAGGKSGEISRQTGIPLGTLNKYVALTSTPSVLNVLKIAKAVGLTVEQLAGGDFATLETTAT